MIPYCVVHSMMDVFTGLGAVQRSIECIMCVCVCVCACSLGGSLQRVLKDKGEFASQTGVADGFL